MKYRALFVIFEKATKFEIAVCCKLKVALYGFINWYMSEPTGGGQGVSPPWKIAKIKGS